MILKNIRLVLGVFCMMISTSLVAQTIPAGELPYDGYRLQKTEALTKMDKGVELTNQGKYLEADILLLEAMDELQELPADLCYHFGRNSYYLEKYSQSLSWLYKYLELKGSDGRYSAEASEYIERSEKDLRARKSSLAKATVSSSSENINTQPRPCKEGEQIKCPVCRGEGVVITRGVFDKTYRTCPFGDDGAMDCETFILFREGRLTLPEN
ncbi:MAG: hypothetical protein WBB45_07335 [Cyclobacteriaceae bacterium]